MICKKCGLNIPKNSAIFHIMECAYEEARFTLIEKFYVYRKGKTDK